MVSVILLVRILLWAIGLSLILISFSVWKKSRNMPAAPAMGWLTLAASIYSIGYAGEIGQENLEGALFWLRVEYLGIPWIPSLWILSARRHSGLPPHRGWLMIMPLIVWISQWTNMFHGLYYSSVLMEQREPFSILEFGRGPIYWMYIAYLYFALIFGVWLFLFRSPVSQFSRKHKMIIVVLSLVPLGGNLIYLCGLSPWGMDLAPVTLSVTAIACYLAIFRMGSFELMPEAHSLVFNNIREAVLIVDLQNRLVDLNPAARELLAQIEGQSQESGIPAPLNCLFDGKGNRVLNLQIGEEKQYFEARIFPLLHKKQLLGYATLLTNITSQIQLMQDLRQKAETDTLTGLANRSSFLDAIKEVSSYSAHNSVSFSVIILDFDRFKEINDQFSHYTGDKILTVAVKRAQTCLRKNDLMSRLGGDEFAILLPQTDRKSAAEVAERVRAAIACDTVNVDGQEIRMSVSMGIAVYDPRNGTRWDELLKAADQALYKAKSSGRNCVSVWE
jgi:diguanylate cyclase (GGDEF)-like protein